MMFTSDNNSVSDIAYKAIHETNTMITYWDSNLICRFANNACFYWFGRKPENMTDKIHMSEFLGQHFEKNLKRMNDALSGVTQAFERIVNTPDGIIRRGSVVFSPQTIDDKVVGFYAYVFDGGPLDVNEQSSPITGPSNLNSSSNQALHEVKLELIANLLTKFPGLAMLAKHHMVSESKLKRDFKQKYGISIFSYYRLLQMRLAEEYIQEKKYTKGQLAMIFNFSNPSNFSACYNKYLAYNVAAEAKQQAKFAEEQSHYILKKQAKLCICVLDNDLCFLDASESWIEYHGLEKIELIGKKIIDVQHISEKLKRQLDASLKGKAQEFEVLATPENGYTNLTRWNIIPWLDKKEVIEGLVIINEAITSTKNQVA